MFLQHISNFASSKFVQIHFFVQCMKLKLLIFFFIRVCLILGTKSVRSAKGLLPQFVVATNENLLKHISTSFRAKANK